MVIDAWGVIPWQCGELEYQGYDYETVQIGSSAGLQRI